jgi:LuxR family transcriptional regulator, maltose regulon positive regulatory protein
MLKAAAALACRSHLLQMAPAATAPVARRRPAAKTAPARALVGRELPAQEAAVRAGFVSRGSLVRTLVGAPGARLVVVVAPPGYGKSSLLREWAGRDKRRFLWLALANPDAREFDPGATKDAVRATIQSLQAEGFEFVLVLDDAHLTPPELLREIVDEALREMREGCSLALASQTEPALPLGRLRAKRMLLEIRVDDLAMSSADASVLLRRSGLELDFTSVQTLVRRTEGWPAALYLAALSLREQAEVSSAVTELRGDDHHLAEYFRDEIFSRLSDDLAEFAVRTSVLDELAGPQCDAVLGREGSALVLTELENATPLLRPVDPAHERYRWHTLVRDLLRSQLRRKEPGLARVLHLRASAWFQGQQETDRAIAHAVRARDVVLTGDLLWAAIVAYVTQGQNEMVQGWLGQFSREELAGYPPLALAAAYSFLAAGDAAEARHCAVTVAAAVERGPAAPATPSLTAALAGIEAMVAPAGVPGMASAAARACVLEPPGSPWCPIYLFLHGTALHLAGDRAAGERLLADAADLSAAAAPSVMSMCLAQAAMIAIEQRDWDAASDLTDRADKVIQARGLSEYPVCALAFAAAAAVRAHDGRADEAKQDLRRGVELLTTLGDFIPWYGAEARILLAHASLWLADVTGARTLLAEASRLARRTPGAVIFQQWFDDAWSHMDEMAETRLAGPSALTIAELRILRFLPSHRSFREIAAQLGVSANTVKTQAHAVYRKLGAASRSEAVARALDSGLLGQ